MALKITLAVLVLILVAGACVFGKMKYEQAKMTPLDTGEILPGIIAVRTDFVNFFLLKGEQGYIAIDAGMGANDAQKGLDSLGISGDKVTAVLLTHTHGDHTGALNLFGGAAVYAGENAPERFPNRLADGEIIHLDGLAVQSLATPGHTDNSLCYLIDGKYLFVGDTLSLADNQIGLFNAFYNRSNEQQAASIRKLAEIEGLEYILSAHYGYSENAVFPSAK